MTGGPESTFFRVTYANEVEKPDQCPHIERKEFSEGRCFNQECQNTSDYNITLGETHLTCCSNPSCMALTVSRIKEIEESNENQPKDEEL